MPLTYNGYQEFRQKVRNFPENYRVDDPSTHIYNLMWTLLEDPGLGQLKKYQIVARLGEGLASTSFGDLDLLFGSFLKFARMPDEQYSYDPFNDQLNNAIWDEITSKDASYRARMGLFLQAILRGGTQEGIAMAAEAASGWPCQVVEMWRVTSGQGLAYTFGRTSPLSTAKEFVIVPYQDQASALSLDQQYAVIHAVDRLKPVNTVCTIDNSAFLPTTSITIRYAIAPSEYFEIRRYVSPNGPIDRRIGWIVPNQEVEAPTFAFVRTQEASWSLNDSVDITSSYYVDPNNYRFPLGALNANISSTSATNIVVDETQAPPGPAFAIKVESEVMLVTARSPSTGAATRFNYTVVRGQDGTTAATHNAPAAVATNYLSLIQAPNDNTQSFGPWRDFDRADSPDNFPNGKESGNPAKYDGAGNYMFSWNSQTQFEGWYGQQIVTLGGQTDGHRFRLPQSSELVPGLASRPEYALASPELVVRSAFFPEAQ